MQLLIPSYTIIQNVSYIETVPQLYVPVQINLDWYHNFRCSSRTADRVSWCCLVF